MQWIRDCEKKHNWPKILSQSKMAYYPKPLLMLPGTLVVPHREHHWPPTKRTDIDDSHNNALLSLSVFRYFFLNSNEVISLFCEKRQKKSNQFFKIETVSEWESHVVLLLEHQWSEKSRSRSWTRQISDKTIVMFMWTVNRRSSVRRKKSASPLRP